MSEGPRDESTSARSSEARRKKPLFVGACTTFGALAAVLALVVGDSHAPAWAATRAASSDNDRSLKLDLVDRLKSSPQILILGSSRAKRAEPAYLRKLTGRSGLNAGVTGGTAADAWVMTRYVARCFPHRKRRYLWFVDADLATSGVNPDLRADPRSRTYLDGTSTVSGQRCGPGDLRSRTRYNPDGSYKSRFGTIVPESSEHLDEEVAKVVSSVRVKAKTSVGYIDPRRYVWFEKALAFMNARGERPVIVLNPIHPAVLAELRRYGFPARRASLQYLHEHHARFDFTIVDAQDIHRWRGSPTGFWDPRHINTANMRLLLAYIVKHSGGALQ